MLTWHDKAFDELTVRELYELLALRSRVFVVEQACIFLDLDGKDADARHLLGVDADGALVAYARLFGPGASYAEASIGRVVTSPEARKKGYGEDLMHQAIARARARYGGPIRIGAQRYLERFYGRLGFVVQGEPYDEDGIPHVEMVLFA
jgi:ElaA protein